MSAVEAALLQIDEVFVYRIPPQRSAAGQHCEEWDLAKPMWQGAVRVMARGATVFFRFVAPSTGQVFAESAPIDLARVARKEAKDSLEQHVVPVLDSSRYFVIRVVVAPLGFGFRERSSAFDMHAALRDKLRRVERELGLFSDEAERAAAERGDAEAEAAARERLAKFRLDKDYSFQEGQRIKVAIKGIKPRRRKAGGGGGEGDDTLGLAPPPEAGDEAGDEEGEVVDDEADARGRKPQQQPQPAAAARGGGDDDWGQFFEAPKPAAAAKPAAKQPQPQPPPADDEWGDFSSA